MNLHSNAHRESSSKLFLLDSMALIYRAFFALNKNPRINSKGFNTSAILGFANTLFDVLKQEKPTHIGAAFDSKGPTVRHVEFETYKANREKTPEDLRASIPIIQDLIRAFNIPILYAEGFEADDVIGTLSKKAESQGVLTYMMTPDKDFGQLVSDLVFIYKPARMGNGVEVMGVSEVCAKFDVENPQQVIDMLGLWGDASDNIPGVPGVGEVTARKLIKQFGSIEAIYQNIAKVENEKLRIKLVEHEQQALDSKRLATILLDVPVTFDLPDLALQAPNFDLLFPLLEELEMRAFAKRVEAYFKSGIPTPALVNPPIQAPVKSKSFDLFSSLDESTRESVNEEEICLLDTVEELNALIPQIINKKDFSFSFETNSLSKIVRFCFCIDADKSYEYKVKETENPAFVQSLSSLFENEDLLKIGYDLKANIHLLEPLGVVIKGRFFDCLLAHYLVNPETNHKIENLAYQFARISMQEGASAAQKSKVLYQIYLPLLQKVREVNALSLLEQVEQPLCYVLANMETVGVKLEIDFLTSYGREIQSKIREVEAQIYSYSNHEFNIASPKQLGLVLFDELKIIENPKHTKTKQYSTGEEVLQKLVSAHPIVPLVLEYRTLAKLKSNYIDSLPLLVDANGRIHTTFTQHITATGRLSSVAPNLQNIPIKTDAGREIRRAFVCDSAQDVLVAADYSQIELRIIAHLSQDETMMRDFEQGLDIHTATAANVFGVSLEEVTPEMRRKAKMVNFGIIYGMSAFGLSERLSIPRKEAADIIQKYFEKYKGVEAYMQNIVASAKELSYVQTILNRRRYLNDIHSANAMVRNFAERNAINAPIQGSSADMIKLAMIEVYKELNANNLKAKILLQVHDELVLNVPIQELEQVKEILNQKMKSVLKLSVPLEISIHSAKNWLEAH